MSYRPFIALLCAALTLLAPHGRLSAAPYPVVIDIDDESDIEQLYRDGEIDEDAKDRLEVLFYTKVDLNLATRDELYELPAMTYTLADAVLELRGKRGRFNRVHDLAGVKGMTPAILDQIKPFVTVKTMAEVARSYEAELRTGAIYRTHNFDPAVYLRGKVRFMGHGGVGLLLAARPMIGLVNDAAPVTYYNSSTGRVETGDLMSAGATALRFDPASLYVFWNGPRFSAIAGSYRIGYGLGLTMDNSKHRKPFGWYPNIDFSEDQDSGKFKPYDGFVGASVRYKQVDLGPGWLDVSAFGSFWLRDIYISDLRSDRGKGEHLLVDDELAYDSWYNETIQKNLYFEFPTLPYIMREIVGGGNVTYWFNRRSRVGVTGYGADWTMTAKADGFGPSVSSKYPFDRNTWGAVGVNTMFGFGQYDFAGELTFTDQGDPALLLMGWISPVADLTIIPSFRYYSTGFDNPYNRGESNGDEYLGNRARDELGGRLRLNYRPFKILRLRMDVDVWYHKFPGSLASTQYNEQLKKSGVVDVAGIEASSEDPSTDLELLFRAQLRPTSKERFTVQAVFHDEALHLDGRERSYEYGSAKKDINKNLMWGGSKIYWSVKASTSRIPRVKVAAKFGQMFQDTSKVTDGFDHSWYAWLRVTAYLKPGPRLVARIKYLDEFTNYLDDRGSSWPCSYDQGKDPADIPAGYAGSCRGESYIDAYFQATQRIPWDLFAGSSFRLRAGYTHWTDTRNKWAKPTIYDQNPTRDEFLINGYLVAKF